jgi:Fe-S-cluster-containing dehydrogenase component
MADNRKEPLAPGGTLQPATGCSRRGFVKIAGASLLGLGGLAPAATVLARALEADERAHAAPGRRWALVVDTKKCLEQQGCRACIDACHVTHNVPAISEPRHEIKWVWKETAENAFPADVSEFTAATLKGRQVPVLCNHCDNPPCVRVCPTGATWKRQDGVVMMDEHRCIGCRFCVVGCPYGSRSFNWVDPRPHIAKLNREFPTRSKGVVEKCNLCDERLARGLVPACVDACAQANFGALTFGDLRDPSSPVSTLLRSGYAIRRKAALGTSPNVFYLV